MFSLFSQDEKDTKDEGEDSSQKDSNNEAENMQLVPVDGSSNPTTIWTKEDENNSSDPQVSFNLQSAKQICSRRYSQFMFFFLLFFRDNKT